MVKISVILGAVATVLLSLIGLGVPASAQDGDTPDAAARTMLLLDSSGSMKEPAGGGKTKIKAAKQALNQVVKGLPENADVGLRVFGSEVFKRTDPGACKDSELVVEPGTDNRADLLDGIKGYKPYGETPIPHALRQAAKDLGDEGARSIVLVSDGESTCDPSPCDVAKELTKDGIDLKIDVVGLSVSPDVREQLKCIAEEGNGTYYDADSAKDIIENLDRVTDRALNPFQLEGEPIEGGTEAEPTEITEGRWTDKLGRAGTPTAARYYSFDKQADTTLRFTIMGQQVSGPIYIDMEVLNPQGEQCQGVGNAEGVAETSEPFGTEVQAGPTAERIMGTETSSPEPEDDCGQAGTYTLVAVNNQEDDALKVGIGISEEPAIADVGFISDSESSDGAPPQVSGKAEKVRGAGSFGAAPEVETGRYRSDIVPGELQFYRVHLEPGQTLRTHVTAKDDPSVESEYRDSSEEFGPFSNLAIFSPTWAEVSNDSTVADTFGSMIQDDGLAATTAQVSRSLGMAGYSSDRVLPNLAGDYYIAISAGAEEDSAGIPVPYTLDVEVAGEPQDGPTYADGVEWSIDDAVSAGEPSSGTESDDTDASSAADGDGGDGSSLKLIFGGAAGLAGVAAVIAGVFFLRRRS